MADQDLDLFSETTSIEDTDLIAVYKKSGDSLWRGMTGLSLKSNVHAAVTAVDHTDLPLTLTKSDANKIYIVDLSSATSDETITLPAEATAGDGWGVTIRLTGLASGFKLNINDDAAAAVWEMNVAGQLVHPVTDGTSWYNAEPGAILADTWVTADGSHTYAVGAVYADIIITAGGGAGGGGDDSASDPGGGGGAGETAIGRISGFGSSETVTIGTGGTGVAGSNGNNGGNSSWGSFVTANGGSGGGHPVAGFGGTGGSGTGFQFFAGSGGETAQDGAASQLGGMGGASIWGGSGRSSGSTSGNGNPGGTNTGAGGAGGSEGNASGDTTGGAGADGVARCIEYA